MSAMLLTDLSSFNTQPPEGGWRHGVSEGMGSTVSTHSRLKAAVEFYRWRKFNGLFQHTAA